MEYGILILVIILIFLFYIASIGGSIEVLGKLKAGIP